MWIRHAVVKVGTVFALSLGMVGRSVWPITYIGDYKTMSKTTHYTVIVAGVSYVTLNPTVAGLLQNSRKHWKAYCEGQCSDDFKAYKAYKQKALMPERLESSTEREIKRLRARVIEGQAIIESLMFGMVPTPDRQETHTGYKLAFDNGYVLSVVTCPSMTRPGHVEVALFDPSDQWAWPEQVKVLHYDELLPTVSSVGSL